MALDLWENHEALGIVSPLRQLTIINANNRFASHCNKLDKFITDRLARHSKVDVQFNTKLKQMDNKNKKLTIADSKGLESQVDFERIYVHIPTKADSILVESGFLKEGKKVVAVNPKTLHYEHYNNLFCIGEALDLPIHPSFYSSVRQSRVAVHNALEIIHGRSAVAEFDMSTKLPIFTGKEHASFYSAKGDAQPNFTNPIFENLVFKSLTMSWSKTQKKVYSGKSAGPGLRFAPKFKKGEPLGTASGHAAH